jgi:hypothetical protein
MVAKHPAHHVRWQMERQRQPSLKMRQRTALLLPLETTANA